MGELKEKILYYLEVYKKQIIIGGIILIFLITSIVIYFCFINNEKNDNKDEMIVEEIVKDEELSDKVEKDEVKKDEVKDKEILVDSSVTNNLNVDVVKKVIVDIKGEVKKPGVYEIDENKRINDVVKMAGGLTSNASTLVNNLSRKVKDEMVIIIYSKSEIEDFKNKKEEENIIIEQFDKVEDIIINDSVVNESDIDSNTNIENSINNDNKVEEDKKEENNNVNDEINNETSDNEENNDDSVVDNNSKISINKASKEELMTIDGVGEKKAEAIIEYRNTNGNFKTIEDIMNVSGIGESMFNKIKDKITI